MKTLYEKFIKFISYIFNPKYNFVELPKNPETEFISIEQWEWKRRDQDGTWHVIFPTTLSKKINNRSYCIIDERYKMHFFKWWKDEINANKPSYIISQNELIFKNGKITIILFDQKNNAVAWIKCNPEGDKGWLMTTKKTRSKV